MSPKKKSESVKDSAKKELKALVGKLRADLKAAEAKVGRLKSKVGGLEETKAELEKQVRKLTKRLEKASKPAPTPAPAAPAPAPAPAAPAPALVTRPDGAPSPTWTVAQLRAEVAAAGVTVPTRATKAQLLAALAPVTATD